MQQRLDLRFVGLQASVIEELDILVVAIPRDADVVRVCVLHDQGWHTLRHLELPKIFAIEDPAECIPLLLGKFTFIDFAVGVFSVMATRFFGVKTVIA